MGVRIQTLGALRIVRDGVELTALPGKPVQCALLVYLAVERVATRDVLFELLWPEKDAQRARRSLNNTVYELRTDLGSDCLTTDGDAVRCADWIVTDLPGLHSFAAEGNDATRTPSLGAFLEGYHLTASHEFQRWADRKAAEVRRLQIAGLRDRLRRRYAGGNLTDALDLAGAWVRMEPFDEDGMHWLIRLTAETGRRGDAISLFEGFRERLRQELDLSASAPLVELLEEIRNGEIEGASNRLTIRPPPRDDPVPSTPDWVWRPEPGWAAKLVKVLSLYAAIGAGLLQVLDYLIGYMGLPESFFPASMVLIALGLPVVGITAFFEGQPVARRDLQGFSFLVARWFSWRNALLGATAAVAAYTTAVVGYRLADRIRTEDSVVILPFRTSASSERERQLADVLAIEVTRELTAWDAIRTVPSVSIGGPKFDLGLEDQTLERTADGASVAREVRAAQFGALVVNVFGDSMRVALDLFHTRNGRAVRSPIVAEGRLGDEATVAQEVAYGILGFDTLSIAPSEVRRGTSSREALVADEAGMRALEGWDLLAAEQAFRSAIQEDPEFGLAHLHLAQTLYWQAARSQTALESLGPSIHAASIAAAENRDRLTPAHQRHVDAFHAFQIGDFVRARRLYQGLLRDDPTDVYAWLMLGSVEYRDRIYVTRPDGSMVPRASLNVARASFAETLRLQPAFALGYGHLFDILTRIDNFDRSCPGFDPEGAPRRAIWERVTEPLSESRAFCPVALDTIEWVAGEEKGTIDPITRARGADLLLRDAISHLRRWAAYAPRNATPNDYMSSVWTTLRSQLVVGSPEELQALADSSRFYFARALELRGDTTVEELGTLASLTLAAGDADTATRLAQAASQAYHSGVQNEIAPFAAINPHLASGAATAAVLLAEARSYRRYQGDPTDGPLVEFHGAEPVIERLKIFGAMGVQGKPVRDAIEVLVTLWSRGSVSDRDRRILRLGVTLEIAPALLHDRRLLARWDSLAQSPEPLWRAIVDRPAPNPDGEALREVLASRPNVTRNARLFLQGIAAERLGFPDVASRRLARLDSIPLRPAGMDLGWGYRVRALHERARIARAQGSSIEHEALERAFLAHFSSADSLTAPLVASARAALSAETSPPGRR